ncbi:hypothetical protein D3C75_1090940 [compost metagenome]
MSADLLMQGGGKGDLVLELQGVGQALADGRIGGHGQVVRFELSQGQSADGRIHVQASQGWRRVGAASSPIEVFDNWPYWPRVCACHPGMTGRRRQAVPNGAG